MGPDGAIYIADWYNPIINHGEVDFRDPRRDNTHGRIWRVTAKGRPLVERPKLDGATVEDCWRRCSSPEGYTRQQAKNVLRERGEKEVAPALDKWVKGLAKRTRRGDRRRAREARSALGLRVHRHRRAGVARSRCSPPRSRTPGAAAAARGGGTGRGQLENPAGLLAPLVTDDEPARADGGGAGARRRSARADAITLAMRALDKPMDPFLDYALVQDGGRPRHRTWLPAFKSGKLAGWADARHLNFALKAVKSPDWR